MKNALRRMFRRLLDLFTDTTTEYWEWTWESEEERRRFIKYWRACH